MIFLNFRESTAYSAPIISYKCILVIFTRLLCNQDHLRELVSKQKKISRFRSRLNQINGLRYIKENHLKGNVY